MEPFWEPEINILTNWPHQFITMNNYKIKLSVVIPVYNADGCVDELYHRLISELEKIIDEFEIIMVNDASLDDSWQKIKELAQHDSRIKGFNLSRNFGQHYAIAAGIDHASGDWIVVMDCDLQHKGRQTMIHIHT